MPRQTKRQRCGNAVKSFLATDDATLQSMAYVSKQLSISDSVELLRLNGYQHKYALMDKVFQLLIKDVEESNIRSEYRDIITVLFQSALEQSDGKNLPVLSDDDGQQENASSFVPIVNASVNDSGGVDSPHEVRDSQSLTKCQSKIVTVKPFVLPKEKTTSKRQLSSVKNVVPKKKNLILRDDFDRQLFISVDTRQIFDKLAWVDIDNSTAAKQHLADQKHDQMELKRRCSTWNGHGTACTVCDHMARLYFRKGQSLCPKETNLIVFAHLYAHVGAQTSFDRLVLQLSDGPQSLFVNGKISLQKLKEWYGDH